MTIALPALSLVVLIGPSGSGKSSFARRHFKPTQVLSSDFFRGLVSDDENDQSVTNQAFQVLHQVAAQRLALGKLTVIDATNVQKEARKPLLALAREQHVLAVAIVFNLPPELCHERNRERPDRDFGAHVVRGHVQQLRRSLRGLPKEGFRMVFVLDSPEEVEAVQLEYRPLWCDRRGESGPFDIIGDIHGCLDELLQLLEALGYQSDGTPPEGRRAIFLGDLVDRGPQVTGVLRKVMGMVARGQALCLPGNHDMKLLRQLRGKNVQLTHGLAETVAQLESESPEFKRELVEFLDGLISHYVLDQGKLVVAHAGLNEKLQGRASGRVRDFALYGETTGETDEFGLPVRYNWALDYRGKAIVVYGHTPVPEPEWLNRTLNIDTGCAFGGRLTALRYPELELVTVPAARVYCPPTRPFLPPESPFSAQQQHDDLLRLEEVVGKRIVSTRLQRNITIREENAAAALEVMSRFAVNPQWLIYLPPTMSPCATSEQPGLLEHPGEALSYYRHEGVSAVVCQEKHMGSRAVVIVCRDEQAARRRFGVKQGAGVVYTRTGRPFFNDAALELGLLGRLRLALDRSGLWEELASDWVCLDCELMPWSAKAQDLIKTQYAAVGAAGEAALAEALGLLAGGPDDLRERFQVRAQSLEAYRQSYRRYCWPTPSLDEYRLAPFHLLASEGKVHSDQGHLWHMRTLARLATDPLVQNTAHRLVDLSDATSISGAVSWWERLTERGGEGMVVKPGEFVVRGRKGLAQPAVKCRGREYLRIIYGPEYTTPGNLERLRRRGLGHKRSLALREFTLGLEALERFVAHEPLYRVHECVFGVLALESEPVDPRL